MIFVAISRRKLDLRIETVVKVINVLDLTFLKVEQAEVLQRMVPNGQEVRIKGTIELKFLKLLLYFVIILSCIIVKALSGEYVASKKTIDLLADEDKFLLQLSKVERISTKLAVKAYIADFVDTVNTI